jgi:hypothetical protein
MLIKYLCFIFVTGIITMAMKKISTARVSGCFAFDNLKAKDEQGGRIVIRPYIFTPPSVPSPARGEGVIWIASSFHSSQ